MKVRDSQRSRIYAYGAQHRGHDKMTLPEIQSLVNNAAKRYPVMLWHGHPPMVADGRGRRIACYSPSQHQIKLPLWARQSQTVLHEIAHAVVAGLPGRAAMADHGPEFARMYAELRAWHERRRIREVVAEMRAARIKVAGATVAASAR